MERYVCIHGHFYQPPRENPWLEAVEIQDSAYPYHDWNARITAECYEPNAAARILDGDSYITQITNNYARISFNFGPTLLSWLEQKAPFVYQAIQKADRESMERFSGHGSAMAQAYNHMIMPLANQRDKWTQVYWGIRDFEHRFGRKPEGMWLPETAVDLETLDILAQHDIAYTVLSPYQAARVKKLGGRKWHDVDGGHVDPTTPYEQRLPSGGKIACYFYDGPISRAVAFERILERGERFAHRLLDAVPEDDSSRLVHIATDGETYGHHHSHGDMGLAYALHYIEENEMARLTNYGEYLEIQSRLPQVEILENTAWSCVHGVERWNSNCGCNTGRAGWHQEWRGPLRDALNWLRDAILPHFEQTAGEYFRDPWEARNEYISVILDRSPENVDRFFDAQAKRALREDERIKALKLMELQRYAMLMFTSCGWFFDELSGIETVQVILYAGHVVQLAEELFRDSFEAEFANRLEAAKSNIPEHSDGKAIYEKWVKPAKVDITKVMAHYAASCLFEDYEDTTDIYCYRVDELNHQYLESGAARLVVGRGRVTSSITHETAVLSFACVHLGDHNLVGGVQAFAGEDGYQQLAEALKEPFSRADLPETIRRMDDQFGGATFSLSMLFREEQRKILDTVLDSARERIEGVYRQFFEQQSPIMRFIADLGNPLPLEFRIAAQVVLNTDLRRAIHEPELDPDSIHQLLEQVRIWQTELDSAGLSFELEGRLEAVAEKIKNNPGDSLPLKNLLAAVDLAFSLPFSVNLFRTENVIYELSRSQLPQNEPEWMDNFMMLCEKLSIRVPQ